MPLYPLKVCPWCNKTPKFNMYYDDLTWLPKIKCDNYYCTVQPECKYVPIRKKQKKNPKSIQEKIERVIGYWNDNNPMCAFEGILLDFELIASEKQEKQMI